MEGCLGLTNLYEYATIWGTINLQAGSLRRADRIDHCYAYTAGNRTMNAPPERKARFEASRSLGPSQRPRRHAMTAGPVTGSCQPRHR